MKIPEDRTFEDGGVRFTIKYGTTVIEGREALSWTILTEDAADDGKDA